MSKQNVDALVSKINEDVKSVITIDAEGNGTLVEGALAKLLPEGVTEESIKAADEAKGDIVSALAVVFGSESKATFDKNKEVEKVKLDGKIGLSPFAVTQVRKAEFTDMKAVKEGKEGAKIVREGHVSTWLGSSTTLNGTQINSRVRKAWDSVSS